MRPLPLAFYAALTGLLEPLAPALLRRRAARGKEDAARLPERLGHASVPRPAGGLVWLHAVSVGEATSLLPLVAAFRVRRPDLTLLVTSGTVTAAELLARRLPDGVIHQYVPVDTPGAVRRFLDHWRPALGVFVESELWPNLIQDAHARGVRLALLSARITEASARGWRSYPVAAHEIFSAFDLVMPQDGASATRLHDLGATPGPKLNLKLAGDPLPADDAELARLRTAIGGRKVVLAASTHPGEDELAVEAFRAAVPDPTEAVLILVPRHPDRGPELARRFDATRRGAGELPTGAIHVADTLGELGLFFRLADVVMMGGAFLPGIGGHNPLEPARIGRPILTGPHAFNAAEPYAELFAEAAAIEAPDAAALARHIRGLLDHPLVARRMGEAALAYARRQDGALDTALRLLSPLLPA
ncbi:MAG: 3-deoxy-D-manno-octulosonic acid transferase [Phenylobacterium zucineum]|nr:MAG: 3-deoxy-D-manno-octulosonic acid transferase [Phenylobacterium zucineum]